MQVRGFCTAVCQGLWIAWIGSLGAVAQEPPVLSRPSFSNHFQFQLSGHSNHAYLIESSIDLLRWFPVQTNYTFQAVRTINATSSEPARYFRAKALFPRFRFALLASSTLELRGNNLRTDSFDSADPNFSTSRRYDPAKRKDGGDVAVTLATNSLSVGNVEIAGRLWTCPGASNVFLGPQGRVGSLMWQVAGYGIQPGWWRTNLSATTPGVEMPTYFGAVPPGPAVVNGQSYQHVIGDGDYMVPTLIVSGTNQVLVVGRARLRVQGEVRMANETAIVFSPTAVLELYVGGATAVLGGSILPEQAAQFMYYGLPANTNVSVGGQFTGAIYAPNATCEVGPLGAAAIDVTGACVARSIVLSGHAAVHFDESLSRTGGYY